MEERLSGRCDLHIHSIFSDSDGSIESIFKCAKERELSCLAITDHDTVKGIGQARRYSRIYDIELIEAIELSAEHNDREIHILGYFIDAANRKLKAVLAEIREIRKERLLAMAEKLNSLGIKVDREEILFRIRDTLPTRLHLGMYLVEKGRISSLGEAFKKYLSPGKPAYVTSFRHSVKEAIQLIKDCGGAAFLAHPHFFPQVSLIEELISFGLDGLEVAYPHLSEAKAHRYASIAEELGILKSGGSDAHGSYKKFTGVGEVTVPYEWVESIKSYLLQRNTLPTKT